MKYGRNDPCPCGSGRKYKKCCGAQGGARQAAEARDGVPVPAAAAESAVVLHNLGAQASREKRYDEAEALLRRAIALNPGSAALHNDLGAALHCAGRREQAEEEYREALRLQPDYPDALSNLGALTFDQGKPGEALPYLEKAMALNPAHSTVRTNLILALAALGRAEEGRQYAEKLLDAAPQSAAGLRDAGCALFTVERWKEAIPFFEKWCALEPGNCEPYQYLGDCWQKQGYLQRAAPYFVKALEVNPESAIAANNVGVCLIDAGHSAEALAYYRRAVELKPDYVDAWGNLGVALKEAGQLESALRCFQMALALDRTNESALWNRSLCLLAMGRLEEGWAGYEYRFKAGAVKSGRRPFEQHPRWAGSSLAGKTILVPMEQGLGDQIALASIIPDLLAAGAHCILECEWRLESLFQRSFPEVEVVATTNPPHPRTLDPSIDFYVPAASLPRWFRPTFASFPKHHGYLVPDAQRAAACKRGVGRLGDGLKVGICWRSMVRTGTRSKMYSELKQWGPILTTPGVQFVNLQYDRCDEELREAERLFGVALHVPVEIDLRADQEGVAALISSLDLVISANTAVDAMAGGLGKATWVLIRGSSDWWNFGADYCPWYPSARPFPSQHGGPWEPVIERLAVELAALVAAPVA